MKLKHIIKCTTNTDSMSSSMRCLASSIWLMVPVSAHILSSGLSSRPCWNCTRAPVSFWIFLIISPFLPITTPTADRGTATWSRGRTSEPLTLVHSIFPKRDVFGSFFTTSPMNKCSRKTNNKPQGLRFDWILVAKEEEGVRKGRKVQPKESYSVRNG